MPGIHQNGFIRSRMQKHGCGPSGSCSPVQNYSNLHEVHLRRLIMGRGVLGRASCISCQLLFWGGCAVAGCSCKILQPVSEGFDHPLAAWRGLLDRDVASQAEKHGKA